MEHTLHPGLPLPIPLSDSERPDLEEDWEKEEDPDENAAEEDGGLDDDDEWDDDDDDDWDDDEEDSESSDDEEEDDWDDDEWDDDVPLESRFRALTAAEEEERIRRKGPTSDATPRKLEKNRPIRGGVRRDARPGREDDTAD